jgi:hypothetical protein
MQNIAKIAINKPKETAETLDGVVVRLHLLFVTGRVVRC